MNAESSTEGNGLPDLSEVLDWRARRTWLVFGGFAVFLGTLSGTIIVVSELIGTSIAGQQVSLNVIAVVVSMAAHVGVLFLLSKRIPPRDREGQVVRGYRILYDRPLEVFGGRRHYLAWACSVFLVALLVIVGQPVSDLSPSVGFQAWLPLLFVMSGAHFPASMLMARPQTSAGGRDRD